MNLKSAGHAGRCHFRLDTDMQLLPPFPSCRGVVIHAVIQGLVEIHQNGENGHKSHISLILEVYSSPCSNMQESRVLITSYLRQVFLRHIFQTSWRLGASSAVTPLNQVMDLTVLNVGIHDIAPQKKHHIFNGHFEIMLQWAASFKLW